MKKTLLLHLLLVVSFIATAQITITDSIVSNGIQRQYRLYIPAVYNNTSSPRPLVIIMHGYTGSAANIQSHTNFMPIADTANFLMVYPQGTYIPTTTNTYWNANFYANGVNDIAFIEDLIDTLSKQYRIDSTSIFATGFSNGGFMSHTLACALSNKIAAIASVSGTMADTQFGSHCQPARAVPVMQIHGTSDATVYYNGGTNLGINMMAVDSVLQFWISNNKCDTAPLVSNVPDIDTFDNCTAIHYVYGGGTSGATVELYKIVLGGHTWPGSFPINFWEATSQDVKASKEIWRFFSANKMVLPTAVNDVAARTIAVYPTPAERVLNFNIGDENNMELKTIKVSNLLGKSVKEFQTNANFFSVEELKPGWYSFSVSISNNQLLEGRFIRK